MYILSIALIYEVFSSCVIVSFLLTSILAFSRASLMLVSYVPIISARLVYQYVIAGLPLPMSIVVSLAPLALVLVALAKTYPGISGASGRVTVSPTLPEILTGFEGER